jgi:superfamily I DNA and RNA helicase
LCYFPIEKASGKFFQNLKVDPAEPRVWDVNMYKGSKSRVQKVTRSAVGKGLGFKLSGGEALNPAQRKATRILDGPVLVIAGAGTGKTLTLVHRLVQLVESGVPAESILLLTFTRRAAQEMIERASGLLAGRCDRAAGGTFWTLMTCWSI